MIKVVKNSKEVNNKQLIWCEKGESFLFVKDVVNSCSTSLKTPKH